MECLESMGQLHTTDVLVQSVLPCQFIRPEVPKQETITCFPSVKEKENNKTPLHCNNLFS